MASPAPTVAVRDAPEAQVQNCWTSIGVRGDRSCAELRIHAHCHNCPVHSAAAARLLDRELPDTAAAAPAHFAAMPDTADEARHATASAVIFRLAGEWYALPTELLDEVVGPRPIHSLPHRTSPALIGLANIRGDLVICVSLAHLLTDGRTDPAQTRLIVAHDGDVRVAFPVDEVQQAHRYRPGDLLPPPATVARSGIAFTRGLLPWRDKMVACLDGPRVIDALKRSVA